MSNKDQRKREKGIVVVTVLVLGSTFIFLTLIDPQVKKHDALFKQLVTLRLDLTKAEGNLLVKDRIEKAYAKIESLIAAQDKQQQISDFTNQINQIYSKLDLKIRSVKILPASEENSYRKLSIRIEMTGSIREFLKLVDALEQHTQPIRMEQFDLTSQETKDTVMVSMIISKITSIGNEPERTNDKQINLQNI